MTGNHLGYVVITHNQASHMPGLPLGADLHGDLESAKAELEWEREDTARVGRGERHVIAEVYEMDGADG